MKTKLNILFLLSIFLFNQKGWSQCDVQAFSTSYDILCGDTIILSAIGEGVTVFEEDFDDCGFTSGTWESTQSADFSDPCGERLDGTCYLWFGASSPAPRNAVTPSLDLSTGGVICWNMKYAVQGQASPCEGIDLPDEGVSLEYSVGGGPWVEIAYFDPRGGNDPQMTSWNQYCEAIPAGAMANNVRIRWIQKAASGGGNDHWGMEDVRIEVNPPGAEYTWQHTGDTKPTGDTPPLVPIESGTYTVDYKFGNCTSQASVDITVRKLDVVATIDPTEICPGEEAQTSVSVEQVLPPQTCGPSSTGCVGNSGNAPIGSPDNENENYFVFGTPPSTGGGIISVGGCTNGSGNYVTTGISQFLVRSNEFPAFFRSGGQIYNMQVNAIGDVSVSNVSIKIACTNLDQFTTTTQNDFTFPMVEVYNGPLNLNDGWNTIEFPQAYDWNGMENIVVRFCFKSDEVTGNLRKSVTGFNSAMETETCSDVALCNGYIAGNSVIDNNRPAFNFGVCYRPDPDITFKWVPSTGVSDPNIRDPRVTVDKTSTFTVLVRDMNTPEECTVEKEVTITVKPEADFQGKGDTVCLGETATLSSGASSGTITWTGPNGFTSNDFDISIPNADFDDAGIYSFSISGGACGQVNQDLELKVVTPPNPGEPIDAELCETGEAINLFDFLTGEDSDGTWSDDDGSGALSGNTVFPDGANRNDLPNTYAYTYELNTNICGPQTATVNVAIGKQNSAGTGGEFTFCESEGDINLFDLLENNPDNFGDWDDVDNTGQFSDPILNTENLGGSTYIFEYTVESNSPCKDSTATLVLNISDQPFAYNDTIIGICSDSIYDLFSVLDNEIAEGGIWEDVSESGALDANTGALNTAQLTQNDNTFYYILSAEEPCKADSAIVTANLTPKLYIENLTLTCSEDGLTYFVSFNIFGGDPNSYLIDLPGTIDLNASPVTYTSDNIASGQTETFTLQDDAGCDIITETVVKSCACVTETDAMDSEELIVCSDETAIASSLGGYVSDGNDTLVYYLHEGSGIQLVNVVDSSHTPEFSFNPATMSYGTTYYISAGAGDNDGNDFVDRVDLCFILSQGTPVKFKPLPEVALDLADQVICTGDSTFLVFNVDEGTAPFVYTISTGETTFDVNSNSVSDNFKVKPSSSTSYAIIRMEDAFCENNPNQSVDLELTTPVRATIIPTSDNCFGANPNFDVELSGAGTEFSITYTNNFNNQEVTLNNLPAGISNVSANFAFSDKVTEYYLTFAEDNSNTVCEPILSDTFRIYPEPSAQLLGGDGTYCPSDIISIPVSLTGIGPWSITISDGASYNFSFNNIQQNDTTLTISSLLPGDYTFSVSALEDLAGGCFGNGSGQVNVTVNPGPIANILIQNPVDGSFNDTVTLCEASTAIDLIIEKQSGNGDLIGELFVGNNFVQNVTIAGTETINIPSLNVGNTRIELRNVQDNSSAGCGGISNPVVAIVNPTPSADINLNGPSTICAGDPVNFFYNVYGNGDISFDIVNQFDERDSFTALEANNFHSGSVNTTNTGTLNYRIENIVDNNNPQCSGTSSSTLTVDVLPVPTADITAVSPTTICLGESVEFEFNLTGDGVVYAVFKDLGNLYTDTVSGTQGTVSGFISNLPVGNHTVEIVEVFNQAGARCDGTFTGSVNITVNDVPDASASYSPLDATCLGDSVNLNLTVTNATFPITVHYSEDATSNTFIDNLSSPSSAILRIAGDLSKSVSIDSIVDVNGCTGYPDLDEPLTVHALPEGQLNGTDLICAGEDGQIEIILSGNGPFNVSFEDNLGNSYNENLNQGSNILTYNVSNDVQFSNLIIVNDNNTPQCSNNGSGIAEIEIRPTPVAAFDATEKLACPPMETIILNQSTAPTGYNFKQCLWEFSDGRSFETCNDTLLTFENVGTYGAKLTIINEFDCVNELEVPSFITVNPNPVANFSYAPEDITLINNVVSFRNNSSFTFSQNWLIDSNDVYTEFEPSVVFNQEAGTQISVCLEAIGNPQFCRDTTCQLLIIEPIEQFYIPNSFTPDDDGINDVFKVIATHYLPGTFEMRIFNQWGEEIFFSNDINVGWDGTYNLDDAKMGIYAVRVSAESAINPGQLLIENATINLMR